jgi:hypothetical protein
MRRIRILHYGSNILIRRSLGIWRITVIPVQQMKRRRRRTAIQMERMKVYNQDKRTTKEFLSCVALELAPIPELPVQISNTTKSAVCR